MKTFRDVRETPPKLKNSIGVEICANFQLFVIFFKNLKLILQYFNAGLLVLGRNFRFSESVSKRAQNEVARFLDTMSQMTRLRFAILGRERCYETTTIMGFLET